LTFGPGQHIVICKYEDSMNALLKIMKALSDPSRVKALKLLEGGELCVCHIQAALGLAQPTVSRHLRLLVEAGLVQSHKKRSWVYYRLHESPEPPVAPVLLRHLRDWLNTAPEVRQAFDLLAKSCSDAVADGSCPARARGGA
jgi:ArsR family transcriptional regulator